MAIHRHGRSGPREVCDRCQLCMGCGASGRVSQGGGYNLLCSDCRDWVREERKAGRRPGYTI